MKKLIKKYRSFTFEERTVFMTGLSILLHFVLAIGKIILSYFFGVFFLVAGCMNAFLMLSKLECFLGVKYPHKKTFKYRNNMIGIFLILAGFEYAIYMTRMIFTDVELMQYNDFLAINIALISFIEMGVAIKGIFNSLGKGHYYRNIKLINMCSALSAIVLTEVALMSFAADFDSRVMDGAFGMAVGVIFILIAIYILIAPKISIVDKKHNVYKSLKGNSNLEEEKVEIVLTNSKFYCNYTYVGICKDGIINGYIETGKSPLFNYNIYFKIGMIILSEILIFPYAVGALIFHFKNSVLIKKLDCIMKEKGYIKFSESEE